MNAPLRIAITADPYLPVPPTLYGGIERVVHSLVRGLIARGHHVTLFAHRDSSTPAPLVPYGQPPHTGLRARFTELGQLAGHLLKRHRDFDLIHSFGRLAALLPLLPLHRLIKIQSYQRLIGNQKSLQRAVRLGGDSIFFTACASHMWRDLGDGSGRWFTIFNGADPSCFDFQPDVPSNAPLIFLGRLEFCKGPHHAVAIARTAGRRLILAGNKVESPEGLSYFSDFIEPELTDENIVWAGPVDDTAKNRLLGSSAALLMPVEWDEPFGIVMAESMACGTPVIAFNRGSVPEVVRDGINGFRCQGVDDAVSSVARLECIDRRNVRKDFDERFSSEVIVDAYERLYRQTCVRS